jgi:hypothetical protein
MPPPSPPPPPRAFPRAFGASPPRLLHRLPRLTRPAQDRAPRGKHRRLWLPSAAPAGASHTPATRPALLSLSLSLSRCCASARDRWCRGTSESLGRPFGHASRQAGSSSMVEPHISPYLPISRQAGSSSMVEPHISPYLPISRQAGSSSMVEPALGTLDSAAGIGAAGRKLHIAFRSPQQLRAFNTPYQLGRARGSRDAAEIPARGGRETSADGPRRALRRTTFSEPSRNLLGASPQAPDSGDAPDDRFETPQDSRLRGPGHVRPRGCLR